MNCLQGFPTEIRRDKHFDYCTDNETVRIEMPNEGSLVKFYDKQNQLKVLFVMYADFESFLNPIEPSESNPEESYTKVINLHIPSGFCIYSKFAYGKAENPLKLYRGEDCVKAFCKAKRLYHMVPEKLMKPLTRKEWREVNRAMKCHICVKEFNKNEIKVGDHCHYTGSY